jgi:O-antigen/teichoic acid export membrane protein
MNRRASTTHFVGALIWKFAPPAAQLLLILIVARNGMLTDVGALAIASALSFFLGALGDFGFSITLAVPRVAFGRSTPPLRPTRAIRITAAALASVLYGVFWLAGIGGHAPSLLILLPLPFFLALSYGYTGALNAGGMLGVEALVSIAESLTIVALALAFMRTHDALASALLALVVARALGVLARMIATRRIPGAHVRASTPRGVVRTQFQFAASTVVTVVQGQLDIVVIGFLGTLTLAALYGPLLRAAYSVLLIPEALSWALYGDAVRSRVAGQASRVGTRAFFVTLGLATGIGFAVSAQPFMRFLLGRSIDGLLFAVLLFALVIPIRSLSSAFGIEIVRSGRQARRIPVVAAAGVILLAGAAAAATSGSITGLAAARLASEIVIVLGYRTILLINGRPSAV